MATSQATGRQQPNHFALKVVNALYSEVVQALEVVPTKTSVAPISSLESPLPFLTSLKTRLEPVVEQLKLFRGRPLKIRDLLDVLEELARWPNAFKIPPKTRPFDSRLYPRLKWLACSENPDGKSLTRESVLNVSSSGRKGSALRRKVNSELERFAPIKTVPRGSEAPRVRKAVKKPTAAQANTIECLREIYTTFSRLACCPKGGFLANISLNQSFEHMDSDINAALDIYLSHTHEDKAEDLGCWKDAHVCAYLHRSTKPQFRKITALCNLFQKFDPVRLKLCAFNEHLFQEGIEALRCPELSLNAPSVPLTQILNSSSFKDDERRKLYLSCLIARAVWQFYDLDWMSDDWDRSAVHFMRQEIPQISLCYRPFLLTDLRSSACSPQNTLEQPLFHKVPRILALGIVLLEIALGKVIVDFDQEDLRRFKESPRANAAYFAVSRFILTLEWKACRKRISVNWVAAIEECLRLSAGPDSARETLLKDVVEPLERLFKSMWLRPNERFEDVLLDPVEITEAVAPTTSSLTVLQRPQPTVNSRGPSRNVTERQQSIAAPTPHLLAAHAEEEDEMDSVLFADEDGEDVDNKLCKEADNWVIQFKTLRKMHGVDRISKRIKLAILDTGIDANHPDFLGKPIAGYKSFVCEDDDQAKKDTSGHGTHIAGIVLDLAPHVDVYIAQVTLSRFSGNRDVIAKALEWARTVWKVDMVSMSFGYHTTSRPDTVKEEIDACLDRRIVLFASASNDGGSMPRTYPGRYDRVLCIHSSTGLGNRSEFNPTPEPPESKKDNFSVLGDGIKSSWPTSKGKGTHLRKSGTSFATPVAASVAAFAIGYIEKNLEGYQWDTSPRSPDGVKAIFRALSSRRDGYDLVSPLKIFDRWKSRDDIHHALRTELGGR